MRFLIFTVAVAVFSVSPAIAKDKKPVDPNKKVCRSSPVTGSIMPSKAVCHTAAEWTAIDTQRSDAAQTLRNNSRNTGSGYVGGNP